MADMLVKLYTLPALQPGLTALAERGIAVRRALVPERPVLEPWVQAHFPGWSSEVSTALTRLPVACFVAVRLGQLLGFACYDVICRNFFGPAGVIEPERRCGIGRALLLATLHAQREAGYAYAIIGGIGPAAFYASAVGAVEIPGSTPGMYAGMLRA